MPCASWVTLGSAELLWVLISSSKKGNIHELWDWHRAFDRCLMVMMVTVLMEVMLMMMMLVMTMMVMVIKVVKLLLVIVEVVMMVVLVVIAMTEGGLG